MRPIVFLDIDDVICPCKTVGGPQVLQWMRGQAGEPAWPELFDPNSVRVLLSVLDEFQPIVVISSSWAKFFELEQLEVVFQKTGLEQLFASLHETWYAIPWRGETRAACIRRWLSNHHAGEAFVIIDDPNSGAGLRRSEFDSDGRLIMCELGVGLRDHHLPAIRMALSSPAKK